MIKAGGEMNSTVYSKEILSNIDMKYINNPEEFVQFLTKLHLLKETPEAIIVDDLDLLGQ